MLPIKVNGGYACAFANANLYLVHGSSVGLNNAYTWEERKAEIVGIQMFPGVLYESNFYKMTKAVSFAASVLEKSIPASFDDCTRYLDLGNGGVVRWNKGSLDDSFVEYTTDREGAEIGCAQAGRVRIVLHLSEYDMCVKIIRENTGIMALDDIDWLNMLLVMGLCVTWVGGNVLELGTNLFANILKSAGMPTTIVAKAESLDKHMTHSYGYCHKREFVYRYFDSIRSFAAYMGLEKHLKKYPRSVIPSRNIRTRIHWCAKTVPQLDLFKPSMLKTPRDVCRVTRDYNWTRIMEERKRGEIVNQLQAALGCTSQQKELPSIKAYVDKLKPF